MTKTTTATAAKIDRARRMLCRHVQQWCEQGVNNVQVRVNLADQQPQGIWFYGHSDNEWIKLPETIEGPELAGLIADELERLATTPQSEECQIRKKVYRDRRTYEFKFHREDIRSHRGTKLGSYLFGILFRERHAPPDPRRQGIRRGMPKRRPVAKV